MTDVTEKQGDNLPGDGPERQTAGLANAGAPPAEANLIEEANLQPERPSKPAGPASEVIKGIVYW